MSRIFITGDTHGDYDIRKLNTHNFSEQTFLTKDDYLIIAGDFGCVWYGTKDVAERCPDYEIPPSHRAYVGKDDYWLDWYNNKKFTTLFVDGNHENHALLDTYPVEEWNGGKIHRIRPSVIHLMRGQVFEIGGRTIFTMGGASSTDKEYRTENVSWWSRELPSKAEFEEARGNLAKHDNRVDYIITHCIGTRMMDSLGQMRAVDRLTDFLTEVDMIVDYKQWYFGHFHRDLKLDDRHTLLYQIVVEL